VTLSTLATANCFKRWMGELAISSGMSRMIREGTWTGTRTKNEFHGSIIGRPLVCKNMYGMPWWSAALMPAPTMLSTTWHPDKVYELVGSPNSIDWIGLDWIGLDWIGLDWIGLDWIDDWIGLDWIGRLIRTNKSG